MKNKMKKFFAAFVFLSAVLVCGALDACAADPIRDYKSELMGGVWQASPVLGSGWAERLHFSDDGTFFFAASEMDGESRVRIIAGDWTVDAGGNLTLRAADVLGWEGGEVVPATGSIGTTTQITGARLASGELDGGGEFEIKIGEYFRDDEGSPGRMRITLDDGGAIWRGNGHWWKYEAEGDVNDMRETCLAAFKEAGLM